MDKPLGTVAPPAVKTSIKIYLRINSLRANIVNENQKRVYSGLNQCPIA